MKITYESLLKIDACVNGLQWFIQKYPDKETIFDRLSIDLIKEDKEDWLDWFICEKLNKYNGLKYAIYAAELVLHKFEDKYPDDKRPRIAVESAKEYVNSKNERNLYDVGNFASLAARKARDNGDFDAGAAAFAAANTTVSAAHTVTAIVLNSAAAYIASFSSAASKAASYAVRNCSYAAGYAAGYTASYDIYDDNTYPIGADRKNKLKNKIYKKIIDYGISLLKGEDKYEE